jgi:predicted ATPase/DNA-binding CsgD family transcriptional regulator
MKRSEINMVAHQTNKANQLDKRRYSSHSVNLPIPLSTFIGRKHEIDKVKQLVMTHRLVTLTGAGGSGKTRLALKSGQELERKFKHGVWFVDLASLRDASLVTDKIASTLGVHKLPKEDALDLLTTYLSKRHLLLILDNCEHFVTACAEIAEVLLQNSPELQILTTSRELLGIPSEVTWVVPPLTLPNQKSSSKSANQKNVLKQVQDSESVQLLVERAKSKNPDFALTVDNCESIAEICNRLDGMPLAIELAAAQVRSLSVQEIAQRLDQRFQFLTGGSRNAPLRQRTLMAAIDWSYALLTTKEQVMLQRLSIFVGGASLEAAEVVCVGGEIESVDVVETISHLVDKSLVMANRLERGETRYRLLETIREYALKKLAESQDKMNVQNKHLEYFVRFAEEGDRKIKGAEQMVWFEKLEDEYNNLHAALKWAMESKNSEAGLKLSNSLVYFWFVHGHIMENVIWLEKFLDQKQNVPPALKAWALLNHGVMLRAGTTVDNKSTLLHKQSLRMFRNLDDHRGIAFALNMMGVIGLQKNEPVKTEKLLTESLALQRELGDPWGIAFTMQNFPPLALQKNDLAMAKEYAEETVLWFERAGDQRGVARSLEDFAEIAQLEGNPAHAVELMAKSLPKLIPLGDRGAIAGVLESLIISFAALRKYQMGALLIGTTEALREEMGTSHNRAEYENYHEAVSKIKKNLSELKYNQARSKGRGMPLEEIVDYVTGETNPPVTKLEITAEENVWFQLTARERDVMRLLAEGHSNLEISQKLFLSEKTVRNYISHIYQKLQITSRGEAILLARKLISTSEE